MRSRATKRPWTMELVETRALVQEGLRAFEDEPNPAKVTELHHTLAHLTAIEAHLAVKPGRHTEAARQAQAAVYGLPPKDSTTRRYGYVCLGIALRQLGELSSAVKALAQADLPDAQQERAPAPVRGLATLAGIQIELEQLDQAERTARRLLAIHDDYLHRCGRRLPIAAFGYARLSEILLERNQLEEGQGFILIVIVAAGAHVVTHFAPRDQLVQKRLDVRLKWSGELLPF